MSTPSPNTNCVGMQHLEGCSFDQVLRWLERSLRGQEPLLKVVPDESPEDPILRQERSLSEITRKDLREAGHTLVRRFVRGPEAEDDYVVALLRLAKGLGLAAVAVDLHRLASDAPTFDTLPVAQAREVLYTLLDLRAPLPKSFWEDVANRHPSVAGVVAVSALLGHGFQSAFDVIRTLPDDEATADALFVVLDQYARHLNANEVAKMVRFARGVVDGMPPQIQLAVNDWIAAQPMVDASLEDIVTPTQNDKLDSGLSAFWARKQRTYEPHPQSAKLVSVAA